MSNTNSENYITKHEAIEDINYFFNNAELIHPNLYFKISKSDLYKQIDILKNKLNDKISVCDFSKKMLELSNHIGDGHTNVMLSDVLYNKYQNVVCRFPFQIKIHQKEFIISESKTNKLLKGDKILSINNITAFTLLELTKYPIVDIEILKKTALERNFSFYVFIEYGFSEKVNLKIKRKGTILNISIELLKHADKKSIPDYTFKTIQDTVGVIQLNTFYDIKTNSYQQFLDNTLNLINNNKFNLLIIDLRNNDGGDTKYVTLTLPYINITKYKSTQKYQVKTSKLAKVFIKKNYIKWYWRPILFFSKMGRAYLFKKDGSTTDFEFDEQQLKIKSNSYKKNVCVLTSNDTYSAAADFVGAFKYAKRGLIVGDTVGQPYSGYIDKIPLNLPHSNLTGGVSFKKYEFIGTNERNKNQGIAPDILIDIKNIETESEIYKVVIDKIRNANNI